MAVPPGVSQPEQMASLKTEQPPVGGSAAKLSFDPPSVNQAVGSTFLVNVKLDGAHDVYAVPVQITYDPHTLELVNISNGGLLSKDGQAVALVHRDDPDGGSVQVSASRPPGTPGVSGEGVVYSLTFMAKAPGTSMIAIARPGIRNSQMQSMAVQASPATITVH
jgi:general secretion pathway protein D